MPRTAETGPFKGNLIRTARKPGKCAWFRDCGNAIEPGHDYVEGDCDPYEAGGFGRDRMCLKCAKVEMAMAEEVIPG